MVLRRGLSLIMERMQGSERSRVKRGERKLHDLDDGE